MVESPFAFYRGAAAVMASDLASTPVTGIEVQACGDAHLVNFGLFASPERTLLFDVNDFDETLPAPWEWDVKRLAASAVVAALQNGFSSKVAAKVSSAGLRSYRERMCTFAQMGSLDVYYAQVDAERVIAESKTAKAGAQKKIKKIKENTSERALEKLTVTNAQGTTRIQDDPPILVHTSDFSDAELLRQDLARYQSTIRHDVQVLLNNFELVDAALKVVGVGSVGTHCFIALFLDHDGTPLILQVKEAEDSVLAAHWKPSEAIEPGQRVVDGQLIMQAASDIFLGWATGHAGRTFYVRQFRDMKGSIDIPTLDPAQLAEYLEICGWALARAHAQSGRTQEIAGYLGSNDQFDRAVTEFALVYADQNEQDHKALMDAVDSGRVAARRGV